jgi:hypothetical protein
MFGMETIGLSLAFYPSPIGAFCLSSCFPTIVVSRETLFDFQLPVKDTDSGAIPAPSDAIRAVDAFVFFVGRFVATTASGVAAVNGFLVCVVARVPFPDDHARTGAILRAFVETCAASARLWKRTIDVFRATAIGFHAFSVVAARVAFIAIIVGCATLLLAHARSPPATALIVWNELMARRTLPSVVDEFRRMNGDSRASSVDARASRRSHTRARPSVGDSVFRLAVLVNNALLCLDVQTFSAETYSLHQPIFTKARNPTTIVVSVTADRRLDSTGSNRNHGNHRENPWVRDSFPIHSKKNVLFSVLIFFSFYPREERKAILTPKKDFFL